MVHIRQHARIYWTLLIAGISLALVGPIGGTLARSNDATPAAQALSSEITATLTTVPVWISTSLPPEALKTPTTLWQPSFTPSPVPSTPTPTSPPTRKTTPTPTFTATPTATPTPTPQLATIDYFSADRWTLYPGDRVMLSWDLHDAREAYLLYEGKEEGVVAPGSAVFTLTTTTAFTLSARTEDGEVTAHATIRVLPVPTPDGVSRSVDVPILMYHYISAPPRDADRYRRDLSVTPEEFEAHLAWLRSHGYQSITLHALVFHLMAGWPLPEKPIVLTFDDGYRDHYTNAFPLLQKYGYVGTFFLVTRPIDDGDPNYLTWEMVAEMHRAGMSMQPHGYRHFDLKGKPTDFLVYEIMGAKEAIEARTGEITRFFCYPSGSYDRQTIRVLESAGFWAAVTTLPGRHQTTETLFELERLRVRNTTSVDDLALLLDH
ncbi:MAG: polysaccharide deacetylase family protein [Anaerolineae bacterium]